MRYAICFTPPIHDPLSVAAAEWLGRNVYSDMLCEQPFVSGLTGQDMAYHTAIPRRYGFHAAIRAPFRLKADMSEAMLLKALMRFAGGMQPFDIAQAEIAWLGSSHAIHAATPCEPMTHLAAAVVQAFDVFRAPLDDAEIERLDPDKLTAPQFSNLYRWGDPHVMEEFRFHMVLTGAMPASLRAIFDRGLRDFFAPVLSRPIAVRSLALLVEPEAGAPFRVHSQHPLGKVADHAPARRAGGGAVTGQRSETTSPSIAARTAESLRRLKTTA